MATPTVFISSTRLDLLPTGYRSAARETAVNAGFLPLGMEDFAPSGDKYTLEKCLEYVSQADLLVVIVAHRYGWIPPGQPIGEAKSVTWLECQYAREVKEIEVLRFVVKDDDDKWKWPLELREEYRVMQAMQRGTFTPELAQEVECACSQLRAFKAWLEAGKGIWRAFDSPAELAKWLAIALYQWRDKNPRFGPALAGDPSAYLEQLWAATRWIDITGLQVGDATKKQFEISRIYIPLTTTAGLGEPAKGKGAGLPEEHGRDAPLEHALAQPRVMILGDPGAGKTTFLRRVAFALCQSLRGLDRAAAERFLGIKDCPFPIFISAAELAAHIDSNLPQKGSHPTARDSHDWIPHFLGRQSEVQNWGLSEEFFRRKLKSDACLLLLDGMDEVPGRVERESLARLIDKAAGGCKNCRVVVTTRPQTHRGKAVLGAEFVTTRIGDLGPEAVHTFLEEWAQALYPDEPAKAETFRTQLERSVTSRQDIRRLARTPVMLTALAVLQANNRRLPEERVGLYESILTWLAQSRETKPGRVRAERCLELLQKLALAMQDHPGGRQVRVGLGWATDQLASEFPQRADAERFLAAEEAESGIIVSRGSDVEFRHLTFQEYLAAREIAGLADTRQHELAVRSGKLYLPEWREVMLLLAGVLLRRQGKEKADELFRAILDELGQCPGLPKQAPCAGLLGAMMRDLAPMGFEPKDPRYRDTVHAVRRIFDPQQAEKIDLQTRIEAAEALGQVGDPRLDEDNWVTIPEGSFWMGAQKKGARNQDPEAYDDEATVHEVLLDAFQLGRYPVTVQEFARFIEDGGYEGQQYWREAGGFGQFQEPDGWQDQQLYRNRPVVGVSWYEAAAYAKWAGVRLPTEAEWERVARGSKGGKYPWGDDPIDPSRANYGANVGRPTPVGLYPRGATSEGVLDMIGNVWEWCSDWYGPYAAGRVKNPTGPSKGDGKVLRGASWVHLPQDVRLSDRSWYLPEYRLDGIGFRCAREVIP